MYPPQLEQEWPRGQLRALFKGVCAPSDICSTPSAYPQVSGCGLYLARALAEAGQSSRTGHVVAK
jgi:hypothetical protein